MRPSHSFIPQPSDWFCFLVNIQTRIYQCQVQQLCVGSSAGASIAFHLQSFLAFIASNPMLSSLTYSVSKAMHRSGTSRHLSVSISPQSSVVTQSSILTQQSSLIRHHTIYTGVTATHSTQVLPVLVRAPSSSEPFSSRTPSLGVWVLTLALCSRPRALLCSAETTSVPTADAGRWITCRIVVATIKGMIMVRTQTSHHHMDSLTKD
jgi:hypothetical protein